MMSYAQACLEELASQGCGGMISLLGALALSYFLEYRDTRDVDAWWVSDAEADRQRVLAVLENTLRRFGSVRIRSWGDVVSVELSIQHKVVFGFQIASRSAQLEEPSEAPWPEGMLLDSFDGLLASKMTALIDEGRGAGWREAVESRAGCSPRRHIICSGAGTACRRPRISGHGFATSRTIPICVSSDRGGRKRCSGGRCAA
jgi:hypothetical protein